MSLHNANQPTGIGPDAAVFGGKSQGHIYLPILVCAVIAGGFALALGLSPQTQALLGINSGFALEIAWGLGGVAVVVVAAAAWAWYGALRWVAVSRDGIRWFRNGREHARGWDEFVEVQRIVHEIYKDGQLTHSAHGAEVRFQKGWPLVIGPAVIQDYEGLIAAIEDGSQRGSGGRGSAGWRSTGR